MDNLTTARNQPRAMRAATREPHTWIMSFLYIGTFGSFIGFGFAFGQVLQNQFTDSFATPLAAASLNWFCRDRKSTRLNSSHMSISYAVFCLKKKKNKETK